MSKKLFVGRLPFDFTDEKLGTLFAAAGAVEAARMIPDPKNGRTRGFGFVDMKTDAEAQSAIEKLNGHTIGDRQIWVTVARPKVPPSPSSERPARRTFGGPGLPARGAPEWKRREGPPRPRGSFGSPRFGSRKPGGSASRFGRGPRPSRGPRP
jgi:RNA recognition motif-containing protein